jgi:tetratricopeptide (TPR) repeat protein
MCAASSRFLGRPKQTAQVLTRRLFLLHDICIPPTDASVETRSNPDILARLEKKIGNEFFRQKNYDVAIEHYTRALKLSPKDAIVYTNLAAASFEYAKTFDKSSVRFLFHFPPSSFKGHKSNWTIRCMCLNDDDTYNRPTCHYQIWRMP